VRASECPDVHEVPCAGRACSVSGWRSLAGPPRATARVAPPLYIEEYATAEGPEGAQGAATKITRARSIRPQMVQNARRARVRSICGQLVGTELQISQCAQAFLDLCPADWRRSVQLVISGLRKNPGDGPICARLWAALLRDSIPEARTLFEVFLSFTSRVLKRSHSRRHARR